MGNAPLCLVLQLPQQLPGAKWVSKGRGQRWFSNLLQVRFRFTISFWFAPTRLETGKIIEAAAQGFKELLSVRIVLVGGTGESTWEQ